MPGVPALLLAALIALLPIADSSFRAAGAARFGSGAVPPGGVHVWREAYLMGTRARLEVLAADRAAALAALESALRVLEQRERVLSTWREDSAISGLNRTPVGVVWNAGDLCSMFTDLVSWHRATGGAFDPAIGELLAVWDAHGRGSVPTAAAMTQARIRSGMHLLTFDRDSCTVTRNGPVSLDVGGFGKGEALDRAAETLDGLSWSIDLGGQVSVSAPGSMPAWPIAIAHPVQRDRPLVALDLRGGSLSTSGGSERDRQVNGTRVGHILDPRSGSPAPFRGSVTVWHQSGLVADILSTALYVMGPDEGRAWAERHGVAALFLIPESGRVRMESTPAFERLG